jgi:hypothetical protein
MIGRNHRPQLPAAITGPVDELLFIHRKIGPFGIRIAKILADEASPLPIAER